MGAVLDIHFIRENAKLVAKKSKQKGFEIDIKELLKIDDDRRTLLSKIEKKRGERNKLDHIYGQAPNAGKLKAGKAIKKALNDSEKDLEPIEIKFMELL